jgi:hypothetical protein
MLVQLTGACPDLVWHADWDHLGNLWGSCQFVLLQSVLTGTVQAMAPKWDEGALLREILTLIDSPGRVAVVDRAPTRAPGGDLTWHLPYYPTHQQWRPGLRGLITYQIDGQSRPNETNPPERERAWLASGWSPPGVRVVRLGRPMSVTDIIQHLARSDAFIGVDSGIAHLAHSVGVPRFLLQYQHPLSQAHPHKHYVTCPSVPQAMHLIWSDIYAGRPP